MRKIIGILGLGLAALILAGCSSVRKNAHLSEQAAAELAAKLANHECRQRFQAEPFTPDMGYVLWLANQWRWQALTSHAGRDVVASVTLDAHGRTREVFVDLQVSGIVGPLDVPGSILPPTDGKPVEPFRGENFRPPPEIIR